MILNVKIIAIFWKIIFMHATQNCFLGHTRLSAMLRTSQMGQTDRIGTVTTARFGSPRTRTFVREIGEISSAVRRRVYSHTRNGARCSRQWECRANHDKTTFRNKLDCLQSHDTRQFVSSSAPADSDAIPQTVGWFKLYLRRMCSCCEFYETVFLKKFTSIFTF